MRTLHHVLLAAVMATSGTMPLLAAPLPAKKTDEQVKEILLKLNELTTEVAINERLAELRKDKPLAKRMVAMAATMHAEAKPKEKPFKFNAALLLGSLAKSQKEMKTARVFFDFCEENARKLDSESKMAFALEALIELAWDTKDYDSVLAQCEKALRVEMPESKEMTAVQNYAVEKFVQATAKKGEYEKALTLVDRFGFKAWYANQLRSFVHREADKNDEAIATLEDALKSLDDEDGLKDETKELLRKRTRYSIANIYVEIKKVDKAADILKGLMKDDPENPTYPNDLGFIWADNDKNMEESEKLIRKALELDGKMRKKLLDEKKIDAETAKKKTAAYLDSMGWVLYKNKKYDEALKYLLEAAEDEEEAEHIEIWDHVADTYMALGKPKEAIETWTKSLKFEDVTKRDIERRKKVTSKLQKAKASLEKKDEPKK
jgi:tetratricopeptide (TPR) repeat protein